LPEFASGRILKVVRIFDYKPQSQATAAEAGKSIPNAQQPLSGKYLGIAGTK
jgi:hypothetical protein